MAATKLKSSNLTATTIGTANRIYLQNIEPREREKALVVSSDLDVVNFATSKGAATISSHAFEEKIAMSAHMDTKRIENEDGDGWIPTTKKKGPSRRLSKKKRRDRVKIRKL